MGPRKALGYGSWVVGHDTRLLFLLQPWLTADCRPSQRLDDKIATDVYVLPRIDLDENDVDSTEAQDALILIDWRDGGKRSQRRFILMLLKWVEKGVAERVGLLGRYYEKWNVSFLERLYKRKVEFELR